MADQWSKKTPQVGVYTKRTTPQVGDWEDTIDEQDANKSIVIIKIK